MQRNRDIFPEDFMFELSKDEWKLLTSQIVIFEKGQGKGKYPKYLPFAFTEHGVTMLANVLKSKKARQTSVMVVRAFIALKRFALSHKDITEQLKAMENRYNKQFKDVYEAINYILDKDKQQKSQDERKKIGYNSE